MFDVIEAIRKKRSGRELSRSDLSSLIGGYVAGTVPDYQVSAFLMAGFLRGFSPSETVNLTEIMLASGKRIDLSSLEGHKVDKHSTGGVGDKVSLILSPLLAELGLINPMMAGRGLGHTGGTIDKLESIDGYDPEIPPEEVLRRCASTGAVIFSQTDDIVPADKMLYALRDATATVESIPLITASIVSKKKAEGIDAIVYDVKCGNGAFMNTPEDAGALADSLVTVSKGTGLKAAAVITDMDRVLGYSAGNALEIMEVLRFLSGAHVDKRLRKVTWELAYMLWHMYNKGDRADFFDICDRLLESGAIRERFERMMHESGADLKKLPAIEKGSFGGKIFELRSKQNGVMLSMDTYAVGKSVIYLGGGRMKKEDSIDHGTGVILKAAPGDRLSVGDAVFEIFYNDENGKAAAVNLLEKSFRIGDGKYEEKDIIIHTLD